MICSKITSPTKERLQKAINKYFYSENYVITDDNRVFNTKTNEYLKMWQVSKKRGRWIFEGVEI